MAEDVSALPASNGSEAASWGPDRPRVVFADDSATQRALVTTLLKGRCDVETASDGLEALKAIKARPPSVVVSDLRMPGLDGLGLLAEVRADGELRRIPFILVTGDEAAALQVMEAGADDYLTKPFQPSVLLARVSAAARSFRSWQQLDRQHSELVQALAESRRLEIELRHAQKLEAVGRLAAGIAHEINTPIQFVGDNTRFLEEAFAGVVRVLAAQREVIEATAPEEARLRLAKVAEEADLAYTLEQAPRTIERTMEGVRRVATIVRAMKEFAHPDQKTAVATDLNRGLLATLEVARNEYKYVAEIETSLGEIPPVIGHPGDLNQVFLNLIVNAAHAIADVVESSGGRGLIRIVTAVHEGGVQISVSDSGGGIPEAIRQQIFDPFFTTKSVGQGTGQGLALARAVVTAHGGRIWFDTAEGHGTTFHLWLPEHPPSAPEARP